MAFAPAISQQNPSTHAPRAEPLHRRIFVGPFPERIIAQSEIQAAQRKQTKPTLGSVFSLASTAGKPKPHDVDKVEEVARTLKEHAYKFFVHEGGKPQDWEEQDEDHLTDELVRKWKESSWGKLWTQRSARQKAGETGAEGGWFGESFEVGTLLGVSVIDGLEHVHVKGVMSESSGSVLRPVSTNAEVASADAVAPMPPRLEDRLDSSGADLRTTATSAAQSSGIARYESARSYLDSSIEDVATSSVAPLLEPSVSAPGDIQKSKSVQHLRPPVLQEEGPSKSDGFIEQNKKGKGKMVHYSDDPIIVETPESEPAVPPEDVLARTNSTVDRNTSAAAAIPQDAPDLADLSTPSEPEYEDIRWGEVLKRDRMLVRILYSKDEGITRFDDALNRTTRNLHFEDWGEFIVAWRKDRIELYCDYRTPGREWVVGHKHLVYVIPLKHSRTNLSLYSFVDASFCITCPPTRPRTESSTSWTLNRERGGTNIFIFKQKSRSRAFDWMWLLWRFRGGEIPPFVEVHNPRLNTKVTIDVPRHDISNADLYKTFTRDNIIDLCMETLRDVPDWKYLMEEQIVSGKQTLQLAWRHNADVDWIWLDDDPKGKPREWSVLYGIALQHMSAKPPKLDIRIASHDMTHVHLKNGAHLDEPPSIEGYLDRIRPNTQTKQQIYISAHGGCLFTLNALHTFPPTPPGLAPLAEIFANEENLRHSEIRRGIDQIMNATGIVDFRAIVAVRRAFQATPSPMHEHRETGHDSEWFNTWSQREEHTGDEGEDEGGDVGLGRVENKVHMRMRRSFELLLTTGHVVRFEAHSCKVALEWINRLRELIFYWQYKRRLDANQEIELAQAARPRLTPQTRVHDVGEEAPPDPPVDLSMPYPAMHRLYNWCVLEGCKPMVKAGRIYMKKGLRGQFKLIHLCLVAGHLVRFRIGSHSSLYPAMKKKINLMDAYVYSGNLAAQTLPEGQYMPNLPPTPRRYGDGLETDDREEDMMFIIKYRTYPQMTSADQDPTTTAVPKKNIPNLSAKQKTLVFKTRSILERDAWCWAINSEIEKIVRAQKPREEALRESGNLVK